HVLMSLFQQLFNATLLGVFLGLLAVRSRSIFPCILFHFLNNAIVMSQSIWIGRIESLGLASWIYRDAGEGLYHGVWIVLSGLTSVLLFLYLWKLDRPAPFVEQAGHAHTC